MNSNDQFYKIRDKTIISFTARPLWKNHYTMELALLYELSKNNNIKYFYCNKILDTCEANIFGDPVICNECVGFLDESITQLELQADFDLKPIFNNVIKQYPHINYQPNIFNSIDTLMSIKYKNFEIGKAIINHLIGNFSIKVNLQEPAIKKLIRSLFYSLIDLYEFFDHYFKTENADYGLTFNGRFPQEAAFLSACEANKINYMIHERGSSVDRIALYFNQKPHHIWTYSDQAIGIDLSKFNYEMTARLKSFCISPYKMWPDQIFNKDQIKGHLPIKRDKKIISIFLSTQEEFFAVSGGPEDSSFYKKLEKLLVNFHLIEHSNYHVIIRDHPNSAKFSQESNYQSLVARFSFAQYFSPTSEIDTYALIDSSDLVITFGSTVGLEALARGKKVVCLTKWYSIYSVDLPGILVFDVFYDSISLIIKHLNSDINTDLIVESAMKIAAVILKFDVIIPGWKYDTENNRVTIYKN
jgi:hypothetical protein